MNALTPAHQRDTVQEPYANASTPGLFEESSDDALMHTDICSILNDDINYTGLEAPQATTADVIEEYVSEMMSAFNPSPGHGQTETLLVPVKNGATVERERFWTGYDVIERWEQVMTPTGPALTLTPKIIEFHVNDAFKTEGFKRAYDQDLSDRNYTGGRVQNRLDRISAWKDTTKEHLPTALAVSEIEKDALEHLPEDTKIVVKPPNEANGRGVSVHTVGELDEVPRNYIIEEFISGKRVRDEYGHHNTGTGRAVSEWEINPITIGDQDFAIVTGHNHGMYWRSGKESLESDASLSDKYVANLARGGQALKAQSYEQTVAWDAMKQATTHMIADTYR